MKQLTDSSKSVIIVNKDELNKDAGRVFQYELNEKKARLNLLKGANRSKHLEIEVKTGCVNLRFSDGAYHEVVLPLMKKWICKSDENILINSSTIKILEAEDGKDVNARHVDTKLVALVDNNRLVIHAYNSTQNVMVQGKCRENFVFNILEPFFRQEIDINISNIKKFNEDVKESICLSKEKRTKISVSLTCPYCGKKSSSKNSLRTHLKACHTKPELASPMKRKVIKLSNEISMLPVPSPEVVTQSVGENAVIFKCTTCEFHTNNKEELVEHKAKEHQKEKEIEVRNEDLSLEDPTFRIVESPSHESVQIKCSKCDVAFESAEQLGEHVQLLHKHIKVALELKPIACTDCNFRCKYNIELKKHRDSAHSDITKYNCNYCDFVTNYLGNAWEHSLNMHPQLQTNFTPQENENIVLRLVAEQTATLIHEMEELKKVCQNNFTDLKSTFEAGIEKVMKYSDNKLKNLGYTGSKQSKTSVRIDKLEKDIVQLEVANLNSKVKDIEKKVDIIKTKNSKTERKDLAIPTSFVEKRKETEKLLPKSIVNAKNIKQSSSSNVKSPHKRHPKILYVTDSVGQIIDRNLIQMKQSARFCTAIVDDSANKCVTAGYAKAVQANLENPGSEHYKYLVLSAPTNDISNIESESEVAEKIAAESSQKMIRTAENALKDFQHLEKVVIMEHNVRFDKKSKARLSQLANEKLNQFASRSPYHNKIFIGNHSLESYGVGITHENRYVDRSNGQYDGVHLWGPTGKKDYTVSVLKILRQSFPKLSKPTTFEYGTSDWVEVSSKHRQTYKQSEKLKTKSISTQNRFQPFNQGNF